LSSSSKIKIEHVGSCSTLIAEKILLSNSNFPMTNEIAYLLTGKRIENKRRKTKTTTTNERYKDKR
jgi:hypothetical protein